VPETAVLEFRMPSLGADMTEGTLIEWCVKPGDRVRRGDIVAVVDTDKAAIEVEIFADGVVEELLVAPQTKVPVGTLLARLRAHGEGAGAPRVHVAAGPPPAIAPPTLAAPEPPDAAPAAAGRARVSPAARRLAEELDVDLAAIAGTGIDGAVTRSDVERAAAARAAAPAAAPADRSAERALAMRRAIAAAMARSKREIPHYYLETRLDLSRALRWLEAENLSRSVTERLLPAALLLKATALALREVPELNGHLRDGAFAASLAIHVGVAISLRPSGLVAPALRDADRRPLGALMSDLRDLVRRARSGSLRSSEVGAATVTVTNLGDLGADSVFPVIHPPQVAIVGFGRVREEAWAEAGRLAARPVVHATLAADHRVSDGHRGGAFLAALERLLQSPEGL
jgi:pyruvate dehydrogenase E2 component (dihydrolipoamide acetyltransferase)